MRGRAVQIAGGAAVLGVIVLLVLTVLPPSDSETVVVSESGDSILSRPTETPEATPTPSPEPTTSAEPAEESTPEATEAADAAPEPEEEPAELPPGDRAAVRIQVVNGGGVDGAASVTTAALTEQSFQPRDPGNAVELVANTQVLFADGQELAAVTVGRIVGVEPPDISQAEPDNPNWAAFGSDLDVLVILGPPLP